MIFCLVTIQEGMKPATTLTSSMLSMATAISCFTSARLTSPMGHGEGIPDEVGHQAGVDNDQTGDYAQECIKCGLEYIGEDDYALFHTDGLLIAPGG